MHNVSEMNATLSVGVTSIHSFPVERVKFIGLWTNQIYEIIV